MMTTGSCRSDPAAPVEDLAKYEGGGEQDDNYRHRMMVNLTALGVTIALALAGVWLAIQIADMRKNQDCRSEEHTSELQSLRHLVCRLLLEKKKKKQIKS